MTTQRRISGKGEEEQPQQQRAGGSKSAALTEADEEGVNSLDAKYSASGAIHDIGSIDVMATALRKVRKQQQSGDDALQHELRTLERKLGIRSSKRDSVKASRARAKLRNELEADGFDLELQDILVRSQ